MDKPMVFTGNGIEAFRLASIEGRLKLELSGIKFRGGSTFTFVKRTFNLKGSRESVLKQFQAYRAQWNEEHGFGTVTSETAAIPRN